MGFCEWLNEKDKRDKSKFIPFEKKAELIAKIPVKKVVKPVREKPYSIVERAAEILGDEDFDSTKIPTPKEQVELDHANDLM